MNAPKKFLRLPAVIELVGMKRATIYKHMKAGTFPVPVQLGSRSVAWDAEAIAEWQKNLEVGVKTTIA